MISKTFMTNAFLWRTLALALVIQPSEKAPQNPYTETAYFASGCFWCVEAIFVSVEGVGDVVSGYAGGTEKNPKYNQVAGGRTSHAEAVMVPYNATDRDPIEVLNIDPLPFTNPLLKRQPLKPI